MRFIPHSDQDVERALRVIGVRSIDELFDSIPASLRARALLNLPPGLDEWEVWQRVSHLAAENQVLPSFQGAGCYRHYVPAVVGQILSRPEFATAYTPYQPEVSQGTLQACFEFQSYVCLLTGLEVANASLYDGASALAEAALMALRLAPRRSRVLVSAGVHPEYRATVETYLRGFGRGVIETVPLGANGRTDLDALSALVDEDTAAVCVGYPNFYGVIEDLGAAAELAHGCGALAVSVTAEALALGLLQTPGRCGADVAVAEGQSLGLPPSYGGPGLGMFATRERFVRQMPGRVVGETIDESGRRGYVLTLATREQHIRREKATSNICTNQGLAALAVTVYLGLTGRRGLRRLAAHNAVRAREVADRLAAEAGVELLFAAPFFNEFAVQAPAAEGWFESAVESGVVPGVRVSDVAPGEPAAAGRILIAVTECTGDADVDRLVHVFREAQAA